MQETENINKDTKVPEISPEEIKEKINLYIDDFVKNHANEDFNFRYGQREAIVSIVETFFDKTKKHYFLQAPTGSGKSIVAIVSSYVLNKFGKTGYILASDLMLQDQYENDFKRFNLDWGSVKGLDNYICDLNGETHRYGTCHSSLEPFEKTTKRTCYAQCPYYLARNKASVSETSLLNYSYWLQLSFEKLFSKRDFIICDESHKIADIVQNAFSPKVDNFTKVNLKNLIEVLGKEAGFSGYTSQNINDIVSTLQSENDKDKLFTALNEFELALGRVSEYGEKFKKRVSKQYDGTFPNYIKKYIRLCEWVERTYEKFANYCHIIANVGTKFMIVCKSDIDVTFKTLNERYLMQTYFHDRHEFSVFMTATMGAPRTFYKNIVGLKAYGGKACAIPSSFDFEKSPIYAYRGHSMSFNKKDENIEWIAQKINEILDEHKGERGIIHCGSYKIGEDLLKLIDDKSRVISYKPGDKNFYLCDFEDSKDKVLMGPSILEGLNLDEDKSRFQIFAKVPFANLADEFVSSKLKLDPDWYQTDAIIKILQGVGRSVRSSSDWATTYILDADFINLWKRNQNQFPKKEFNDRLHFVY